MTDGEARVSAHYMIDEDGTIYALVPEDRRAWHAGVAAWAGEVDINSVSLGIELVNPGHATPGYAGGYRPFPEPQMIALERLAGEIVARHRIPPGRVLGHSDVAPARKTDPGELFDWERLARAGIGLMPRPVPALPYSVRPGDSGRAVTALQRALVRFGYGLDEAGVYGAATETVVKAFQRHFRRTRVDGIGDGECLAKLDDLIRQMEA